MLSRISKRFPRRPQLALLVLLAAALPVHGQEVAQAETSPALISFSVDPMFLPDAGSPLIKVARTASTADLRNGFADDTLDFSIGLHSAPLEALKLDANVWHSELDVNPLQDASSGPNLRSSGFDIGAAYAWTTERFGQFTLSTKAGYVRDFYDTEGLFEAVGENLPAVQLTSPELRSNLKLSWEFGNHMASAITRYFDSSRDLSELGVDEINDLVDSITTVDLEYGYHLATDSDDRAVISFGIQNVFDRKTMQILNSATRILDQNGRVAYGRIKYQF